MRFSVLFLSLFIFASACGDTTPLSLNDQNEGSSEVQQCSGGVGYSGDVCGGSVGYKKCYWRAGYYKRTTCRRWLKNRTGSYCSQWNYAWVPARRVCGGGAGQPAYQP